ncbi:Hypothetical predicted protein [Paramuricea clavata]|uniref:Uncharacterized protein n=1 Tax=Paramuricea clavata TaxID=317549 RepID=A0A7D9HXN5_PARCT|nr:Hypothetical predicted protein [Paramuricea clavata]
MIKISRSNYISSLCTNIQTNSKRFWSLFELKGATRSVPEKISIKTSVNNVREYTENPRDIATLFNRYFVSIFSSDPINIVNQQSISETTDTIFNDIVLSEGTVRSVLRNLDNNKAHGPDEIPARLLTETAYQIAPSLCLLFNKSLKSGIVPREWRLANVVPIHKKGDKDHVENCRPIFLLSLVSKVLERCVFICIKEHAFSQINSCQHGFISGKSCMTQLIEVLDIIGSQLDLGKQIDVIYLDMSKAFDREFGFGGNLLMWFNSYLKNRQQQTTVLGATSTALPVTSGVPQGFILGPLLFLLYTNDLSSSIVNSNVAAFADDTKIFKVINSRTDAMLLQNDLLNFNSSSSNAGLHLNTSKCKTLQVTRKHNKIDFPYQLQDTILEKTDCELDLGVWTNYDLTLSKQFTQQSNKANKMLREDLARAIFQAICESTEDDNLRPTAIKPLCGTRWSCRLAAIQSAFDQYPAILQYLEEMVRGETDTETKANGQLDRFQKGKVFLGLKMAAKPVAILEQLNSALQAKTENVSGMVEAIKTSSTHISAQNTDEAFHEYFSAAEEKCEDNQLDPLEVPRIRGDQANSQVKQLSIG